MSKAPTFDDFWLAYPLHKGKKPAERAWNRLTAGERRKALAALAAYRDECQQRGIAYKYAQGWLNDRRWEDETDSAPSPTPPAPSSLLAPSPKPSTAPPAATATAADMDEW